MIQNIKLLLKRFLPTNTLRFRFAKGVFWSFAGTVIYQALTFAAYVAVARLLGKVAYGKFGMILSTVGMLGIFAGMGLSLTATKHVSEFRLNDPERAGRIIGMSSIAALISGSIVVLILFVISPYLATRTINAPQLATELRIGCGLLFFGAINGAQLGVLSGLEAFRTIAKVNLIRGISNFLAIVVGVYFWALPGAIGATVVSGAASWLVYHIALRIEVKKANVPVSFRNISSELPLLWSFSLPAFLGSALVGPVLWGARAMLANQVNGYAQLGIFTAAQSVMTIIRNLPTLTSKVSLPMLSQLYAEQDKTRYRVMLWKLFKLYALGCTVAMVPLCVFSRLIMAVYGTGFSEGAMVLCILAVATSLWIINTVPAQAIAASGKMWWGLLLNGLWGFSLLACSALMVSRLGVVGLALAFLIAYSLHSLWTGIYVYFAIVKR